MHVVMYCDPAYVRYATISLHTFFATQPGVERLTLLHPATDDADSSFDGQTFVQFLEFARNLDPRVQTVAVDAIVPLGAGEVTPELYTDRLRSRLVNNFSPPVLWADLDMIFLEDLTAILGDLNVPLGAADDIVSTVGDQRGLRAFRAFQGHASKVTGQPWVGGAPINCGLLLMRDDPSEAFDTGLDLAQSFLLNMSGPPEVRAIAKSAPGQLAWNYAFHAMDGHRLPRRVNRIPRSEPVLSLTGEPAESDAAVLHYLGLAKPNRMVLDFVTLVRSGRF